MIIKLSMGKTERHTSLEYKSYFSISGKKPNTLYFILVVEYSTCKLLHYNRKSLFWENWVLIDSVRQFLYNQCRTVPINIFVFISFFFLNERGEKKIIVVWSIFKSFLRFLLHHLCSLVTYGRLSKMAMTCNTLKSTFTFIIVYQTNVISCIATPHKLYQTFSPSFINHVNSKLSWALNKENLFCEFHSKLFSILIFWHKFYSILMPDFYVTYNIYSSHFQLLFLNIGG